jgi:hypothetical protein
VRFQPGEPFLWKAKQTFAFRYMERSADKRTATVLKTVETRKLWVRGQHLSVPPFIGEKPKKPRRLAWDQDISTCESCFPDHFNSEVE